MITTRKNEIINAMLAYLDASDDPSLEGCFDYVAAQFERFSKQDGRVLKEAWRKEVEAVP